MQDNHPKLDAGRAWTDAMALLNGQRDILLTVVGFFMLLPQLFLNALRPFVPTGSRETLVQELMAWTNANFHWIALVAVLAALGRLAILVLLLEPGRPTVGEALRAGARLVILFVVMDLLIGFMLLGGLFLFVLPGLYIFGRTFLAEIAFVANRARNPIAGIRDGFHASHGNGWRIVAIAAIIYIAGAILTAAVGSVIGVLGALAGGTGLDAVLTAFIDALFGAGASLILTLLGIAMWRQLSQDRNVRR